MSQTACAKINELSKKIVKEFKTEELSDRDQAIKDYENDCLNYLNFPEKFDFNENKSTAHKELAERFKKGYEKLNPDIKKQFKLEFYKKHERRCPMCGQLLETSKKSDSKIPTADLDHFYPKDKFPQFALLPQNLIPTCMECNRIEKLTAEITPSEFKGALSELNLLIDFKKHPQRYFKIWHKLEYDFDSEEIKLQGKPNTKKLIALYGLEERYLAIKEKCFNILFNIIKHSDIRSPESLEKFLENMASANWHEVNDGYSLNNSPEIWQEFIEDILYNENKLIALWEEVKDYSKINFNFTY